MNPEFEEEMTALQMSHDLDKMERDLSNSSRTGLKLETDDDDHFNDVTLRPNNIDAIDHSFPPNTNNLSNPANKCAKKSHGNKGQKISVEPILHVQHDNGLFGNTAPAESGLINNETNKNNNESPMESMPGTSGVYSNHGSPSTSSGDRAAGVEVAVVRISNI